MDCQGFRRAHLEFTDGTLPAAEHRAAQEHVDDCPDCARFDCRTRRAMLLVRNLPTLEPLPGFYRRFQARLGAEARAARLRRRLLTGAAAAAAVVGVITGTLLRSSAARLAAGRIARHAPSADAAAPAPRPMVIRADSVPHTVVHFTLWPEDAPFDVTPARFAGAKAPPFRR